MKRLAILSLLVPSLALAQPMIDPREMSGVPRPDQAVASGLLTVKVISGELAAWAPIGTLVHVVAMRKDGVKLLTTKVNDEGRAEFPNLATDGLTAYYALSLFGEDRLISQPAVLPPKVGVRMMLTGRKRDKAGQAIGPAIDEEQDAHQGVEAAPQPLAPGAVEILARGRIEVGADVVVRELASGQSFSAKLEGSAGTAAARFTGLPSGPDKVYVAEIGRHRSTPFMLSPTAGARRMILAYEELLFALQGGGQVDEEKMWFELNMTIANLSGAPVDPGPDGLRIPLPAGFRSATMPEEQMGFTIVPGLGILRLGAIPPGQVNAIVQFAMPAVDGKVVVDMPAPLGMFQSQIAIQRAEGMTVEAKDAPAPEMQRASDGREYLMVRGFTVAPGESLKLEIGGLPMRSAWSDRVKALVGALVLAMIAVAIAVAVRRPRVVTPGAAAKTGPGLDATRKELGARRERLYAELVALERARAAKRIDDAAFSAHRRAIMAKLVLVHREMDDLDTHHATS